MPITRLYKLSFFDNLLAMGKGFGVKSEAIVTAIEVLGKRLPKAFDAVEKSLIGAPVLRKKLIEKMEKRYNLYI